MRHLLVYLILIPLGFLFACESLPQLTDFDAESWKKDRKGCNNQRKELIPQLKAHNNLDKLKGLGQNQIMALLGKPDVQELFMRNQRFYIYFLEEGQQCDDFGDIQKGALLRIRFSALDRATEVVIQ